MSNILNSEDFGLKIYNRFPPKYREDDTLYNYSLKRYLQALSDGGFKYSIDEINGITSLIDPDNVDSKVLPILFQQYGLDIFNGIPEEYLRYLVPKLGEAWSKKGSLSVVEFITSSLSGIKTSTDVYYDENNNPIIDVKLEMDYNMGDYFPEAEQFTRLLNNFVPFYCDINMVYSYLFYESQILVGKEKVLETLFLFPELESASIGLHIKSETSAVLGEALMGVSVLGTSLDVDTNEDLVVEKRVDSGSLLIPIDTSTNRSYNVLNSSFFTNGLYCYDLVTVGGTTEIVF